MKTILSILLFVVGSTLSSYAQSAKDILESYITTTGISSTTNKSIKMDLSLYLQGNLMKMTSYINSDKDKGRYVMDFQGNEMIFVVRGKDGWIESEDQIQPLPPEFVSQTKFISFFTTISNIINEYDLTYEGEADKDLNRCHVVSLVSKQNSSSKYTVYINKLSNLIEHVNIFDNSYNVTLRISEYKKFHDVYVPTKIEMQSIDQSYFSIIVNDITFGIDIPEEYFEKP